MEDCLFCKIIKGEIPASIVYKDEYCTAFMDIKPVNAGHVLVIPNNHAAGLADLNPEDGEKMFAAGQKIAAALKKSGIRCEGINYFLADGKAANQEVFHVHLHVFPRFTGDGCGLKVPPEYYERTMEREKLEDAAEKIITAMDQDNSL